MQIDGIEISEEEIKERAIALAAERIANSIMRAYGVNPTSSSLEAIYLLEDFFTPRERAKIKQEIKKRVREAIRSADYERVIREEIVRASRDYLRELVLEVLEDVISELKRHL